MLTPSEQIYHLSNYSPSFEGKLGSSLSALSLKTFQINLGKWCNQACHHCHVDASPKRTETMGEEIIQKCIYWINNISSVEVVDITGGAPEGHPKFTSIVSESIRAGKHVIDRCNLTILEEEGFSYLYDFLSENKVEIIASLPHFAKSRTDGQRGRGVFDKSIIALQKLNNYGYGSEIPLSLVYNPSGLFLSSDQKQLEREYRENLFSKYNIKFNNLYCINNIPINRFLNSLLKAGKFNDYMDLLSISFNPDTLPGLMCRHQISIGYDGSIYDCDFNQMLDLKVKPIDNITNFNPDEFLHREIIVGNHCFGCTAGAGSSCGGELV